MTLPPSESVLERERRWLRPAGLAALAGTLLFAAGQVVQQVGLDAVDNKADRLTEIHEHAGQVLAGQILQAIGIAMFAIPLYVLFRAAEARAERMRGALVGFCLIGPILFGVGSIVLSLGIQDAADQFVDQAPAVERQNPNDDAADEALDDLADDVEDDSSLVSTARYLLVPGVLSFLLAMVYTCLWSTRTGLLTRFWGSLGMALGVALILLGSFGLLLTVLWFAVLGFRFAGISRGGLPPAWGAGVAIPWEPPGGAPPQADDDEAVEGSGRELSEPTLPEGESGQDEPEGPPPKKRKRRS